LHRRLVATSIGLFTVALIVLLVFALPTFVRAQYGTLTLQVTDTETGRSVDDVEIYVDNAFAGTTAQGGELDVPHLDYGRHRVSVLVPYYEQCKVDKYVDVAGNITVPVSIDMPNPSFQISLEVATHLELFNEYGSVEVTLTNVGDVVSQDTIVLILVYLEGDTTTLIASRIINFGNVAAGALPIKKGIPYIDEFKWRKTEHVSAVVVDRWKYTPQNEQVVTQAQVPIGLAEQVICDACAYIKQHPEVIGTIAEIILK